MRRGCFLVLASSCLVACGSSDALSTDAGPVVAPPPPAAEGPAVAFSVQPELEARFPTIRAAATAAFARWGLVLQFDQASRNLLKLDQMRGNPDGTHAAAVHRYLQGQSGERLTALNGGASQLVISESANLFEGGTDECVAAWSEGEAMPALLVRALTHEVGHMLGLPDEQDDYNAAMFWAALYCTDLAPTDAELLSAQSLLQARSAVD